MGKRTKRIFDRDFKIEVSKMAIEDNISVANLGKSYGIAVQVIYRWIDEYKLYGEDAFAILANNVTALTDKYATIVASGDVIIFTEKTGQVDAVALTATNFKQLC